MNCIEILSSFLKEAQINPDTYCDLFDRLISSQPKDEVDIDINKGISVIYQILVDTYALNAQKVKKCADIITKKVHPIGRREKDYIKHYLDYSDNESILLLQSSLNLSTTDLVDIFQIIQIEKEDFSEKAKLLFIDNWNIAENNSDSSKQFDYLQGIYSRLTSILSEDQLSLYDLYKYNSSFIEKELSPEWRKELFTYCFNDKKMQAQNARSLFCEKYNDILSKTLIIDSESNKLEPIMNLASSANTPFEFINTEECKLVLININQAIYDNSRSYTDFFDRVLSILYYSYRVLDNHRTLAINIDNIFTESGVNLKWMLYSYIGIYAEHFIPTVEKRMFYKPEELCYAKCEYIGIDLNETQKNAIREYFKGKGTKNALSNSLNISNETLNEILLDFEKVWYGYTFSDCIAINSGDYRQNKEISFIKNTNQILLIFNKYRHDDRKIPCPECAGLDISGNSFPEVGLRSWECKNPICPSRSKSNRGKRYSKKSNFMQLGFENNNDNDIISRDMLKQWRRDIANVASQSDIYQMLIKYFSFDEEKVLFVNADNESLSYSCNHGRFIETIDLKQIIDMQVLHNEFEKYFNGGNYVNRYLNQIRHDKSNYDLNFSDTIANTNGAMLIHGDSRSVLSKIPDGTFTAAVTSPPYYNARLYSQWPNLYLYLSDMYEIIKEIYRTMKPGGVYLYNIGDVCGNENTVVRSTMGNKRILLGAYTIHLFTAAGFELLDNILWDKGNPQSNRQKNDGKFTPFYQKPMNVYEHMFVFKKPGAPAIINNNVLSILPQKWNKNIVPFIPVIKINSKGENTLGHTAPFPEDIPNFVAKVFTRSNDDIVLEPFAGSGTTLISCSKCKVKSLGIELCSEYVDLAIKIGKENNINIACL